MRRTMSRRHRALRSLALLAALVLAMQYLGLYNFTPGAVLRARERELGIGRTELLARADFTDSLDMTLSAWEDRLLLVELRFDPLGGWRADNSRLLRRESGRAVQLEAYISGNQDNTYLGLCGWVSDPAVERLELRLRCRCWYGDAADMDVFLSVTDFQSWQGERVFLLTSRDIPATYTLREAYLVTDQGETLLYQE